jgi:hypothetical protein
MSTLPRSSKIAAAATCTRAGVISISSISAVIQ